MLAVQPDNWRNRSIHADMESCSPKKLLNEPDSKKHAWGEELALLARPVRWPILTSAPRPMQVTYSGLSTCS